MTLNYSVPHAGPGTKVESGLGRTPWRRRRDDRRPAAAVRRRYLEAVRAGERALLALRDCRSERVPVSIQYWPNSVEIVNRFGARDADRGAGLDQTSSPTGSAWAGLHRLERRTRRCHLRDHCDAGERRPPVRDAVPASQVADVLPLAPGDWSVTVQSVAAGDQASLPSAPAAITVP